VIGRVQGVGLRAAFAVLLALGALAASGAARAEPPLVPTREGRQVPLPDRLHERGATLLRFREGRLLFALVLDAKPAKIEERRVTLADGRKIDFRWSARSLWIAGEKFELPFGDVILVSTRDSVRAQALEFRAVRGELLLAQLAADPGSAAWIEAYGTSGAAPARQDAQAATEPRHTTEIAEWTWRGLYALTYVLSGEPLFVLVSDRPVYMGGTRTSLGGFDEADARIGARAGDRLVVNRRQARFELLSGADHPRERVFELAKGRAFLVAGDAVRQADARLDLGAGAATALLERIEALPEVARHLGLADAE
jgi:hypothetical protein